MPITSLSSREFNQHTSKAKKAALQGPVFISDRGKPSHVLLSIEDYQKLAGGHMTLLDAIAQVRGGDFEFEPPRLSEAFHRPADLS